MPYKELVRKKKLEEQLLVQAEADAEAANKRVTELSSLRNNVRDPYKKMTAAPGIKFSDTVEDIDDDRRNKYMTVY